MVLIATALESLEAKEALVPEAPVPSFPYSAKVTCPVLEVEVDHTSHPAELMMLLKSVFWKTTRAYSDHGRPR
jgi:hypothetical protein